jgi:hypothetical protein
VSVVWGWLKERTVDQFAADCMLDVAACCPEEGYLRLSIPYMSTDDARNMCVDVFRQVCPDPQDTLVMLDADHLHPPYIVVALSRIEQGVVGALAFRRSESSDPLFFMMTDGKLRAPAEWTPGTLYACDFVGTGAIAIKRWVFDKLIAEGEEIPLFRKSYVPGQVKSVGEDRYFADLCMKHGIKHHCATSIEIPHMDLRLSTSESWVDWKKKNADRLRWTKFNPGADGGPGVNMPTIRTAVKG